jgi:hypothetical protein
MNQALYEAERLFGRTKPAPVMSEYELEQLAIRLNFERLKAERLAREADQSLLPLSRLSSD